MLRKSVAGGAVDRSEGELQELRRLLGELTARVFRIEQALNLPPEIAACRRLPVEALPPDRLSQQATRRTSPSQPPAFRCLPTAGRRHESRRPCRASPDLESRIGSHWLNRIGISAVLIGVSYFLKFAFDNNWIGPTGPCQHRRARRHCNRHLERDAFAAVAIAYFHIR